jgi:hypothetical protein
VTDSSDGRVPIYQLSREISRARDSGAFWAALALVYVGIDTMALLACPFGQAEQKKKDFIRWVDKYLRADPASEYQYEGVDVYAARCALLHSYTPEQKGGAFARAYVGSFRRAALGAKGYGVTAMAGHKTDTITI